MPAGVPSVTRSALLIGGLAAAVLAPSPAAAQLGLVESLFRNVTDVAFYTARSGALPDNDDIETGDFGLYGFGVELLFGVGTDTRRRVVSPPATPHRYVPRELRVTHTDGAVDSVFVYEIVPVAATVEVDTIWLFELGIGYGQLAGFDLAADDIELTGAVRELPAVSFYATHNPSGAYFGVRSGLLQTSSLNVHLGDGTAVAGTAQTFQLGAAIGYGVDVRHATRAARSAGEARRTSMSPPDPPSPGRGARATPPTAFQPVRGGHSRCSSRNRAYPLRASWECRAQARSAISRLSHTPSASPPSRAAGPT